ncbi:hypothetical protein B0T17DRAFT_527216 [Bombardia bombarda]|uniref:Deacetylase sirtuin-type domain-containing protein n=1 Tax=Bombardia bombarda TaxID=252184 RepID=A0AA40CA98_9PEZI|nr:hypothetical protein B0T17DRAFT_527216 [Bombardia bombarda]
MVMFDETHPRGKEIARIANRDALSSPDLLLVLGTSLTIEGTKQLLQLFAPQVRERGGKVIYVNRSKPPSDCSKLIDYWV